MNIEIFLTSTEITEDEIKDRTVIVIDVFRTSTTIVEALSNGARAIVPVPDMEEAGKVAANLDPAVYLLGGEKDGSKIEGYHLGNSPFEYDRATVTGKTIILNTINGTRTITRVAAGHSVVIGGFVNAGVVVQYAKEQNRDVTIVCSGWKNRPSLEDTLCAGLFAHELWDGDYPDTSPDATYMALSLYRRDKSTLARPLNASNHARRLKALGLGKDIDKCIGLDTCPLIPIYRDSRIENLAPA